MAKEYALYKGAEILAIGTVREIAQDLNINEDTVRFYLTPSHKKRTSENARRLVVLEDD